MKNKSSKMRNTGKNILTVMSIAILAKGIGFVREVVLASTFGTTAYMDAYLVATTIPLVIFSSLGDVLKTAFIPLYTEMIEKEKTEEGMKFTNNILMIMILGTSIISILGIWMAKPLVSLFAVGFQGETFDLAVAFTRVALPGIVFIGGNTILTGFLQAHEEFRIPALISLPNNIIIMLSILLSSLFGHYVLIYGTIAGLASEFLFLFISACKRGYIFQFLFSLWDKRIQRLLLLIAPVSIGMALQQINVLVDRTLASTLPEGSIAALNYANKLDWFVYGVFISPMATVLYPMFAQLAVKESKQSFKEHVVKAINAMLVLITPVSIGAMCLSTPVVKVLFERGLFDQRATQMTSVALFFYSIGIAGYGLRNILTKAFYSMQDTLTPMKNGAFAVLLNILLNLILSRYMAHGGLALATSISALFSTMTLIIRLRHKIGPFGGRKILLALARVLIASAVMAGGVLIFYNSSTALLGGKVMGQMVSLLMTVLFGALLYFIVILLLKIEEADDIIRLLKSKLPSSYKVYKDRSNRDKLSSQEIEKVQGTTQPTKLLLGIDASADNGARVVVSAILALLPKEKYSITLVTAPDTKIIRWVEELNNHHPDAVKVVTCSYLKSKISLYNDMKAFFYLYRLFKKGEFEAAHFHLYKLGWLGRWAAWLAKVPKIFYSVYGWNAEGLDSPSAQRIVRYMEKLPRGITTRIICISRFQRDRVIDLNYIDPDKVTVIPYGLDSHPIKKGYLRGYVSIPDYTAILGTLVEFPEKENPLFNVKVLKELLNRGCRVKLVIVGDKVITESCASFVSSQHLSQYVYISDDEGHPLEQLYDFDIYFSFSQKKILPISIMYAISAGKPVIANNSGGVYEFVHHGWNGFLLDQLDVCQAADYAEELLKNRALISQMGNRGRQMMAASFSRERMLEEYDRLYSMSTCTRNKLKNSGLKRKNG